jgi:membrane protease YdiL (CAAX protease family)
MPAKLSNAPRGKNGQDLIRQIVAFVAITVPGLLLAIQLSAALSRFLPATLVGLVTPAALSLGLFVLTRWMLTREGRSPLELGADFAPRRAGELTGGFVGAIAFVAALCGVVWLVAPFHWRRNPDFHLSAMAARFALLAASNTGEELFFRGYIFDRLIRQLGIWRAQIIIAVAFAVWHMLQGVPWIAALVATGGASFLFGSVFHRWRSIPAAAGLHIGANFFRDMALPVSVSSASALTIVPHRALSPRRQLLLLLLVGAVPLFAGIFLSRRPPARSHVE